MKATAPANGPVEAAAKERVLTRLRGMKHAELVDIRDKMRAIADDEQAPQRARASAENLWAAISNELERREETAS